MVVTVAASGQSRTKRKLSLCGLLTSYFDFPQHMYLSSVVFCVLFTEPMVVLGKKISVSVFLLDSLLLILCIYLSLLPILKLSFWFLFLSYECALFIVDTSIFSDKES